MTIYQFFKQNKLPVTPDNIMHFMNEHGGSHIRTFKDEIFTENAEVTMDTEETIVLKSPVCNMVFPERVEINPNFIVSITYFRPKSKIIVTH